MFTSLARRHSRCLRPSSGRSKVNIWEPGCVSQHSKISPFSTTRHCDAVKPRIRVNGSFDKVRFTPREVPPLGFWQNMARPPLVSGLDPEVCFKAAHTYVDLAIADRPGWRNTLRDPPHSLSPATLHYLAAMIMAGSPGPAFTIALHIYQTLVSLNYAPSVLTMTRLALLRKLLGQPQFDEVEKKFAALARRKDDPNACTLQGLILAEKKTPETDKQALEWFRTAASLGGEAPGAWEWQGSCAVEMGNVYLRLGNPQRAREIWKYSAETLDAPEAAWLYASLLDDADPEKYVWVRKAAVSGVQDAAREMARLEGLRALGQDDKNAPAWEKKKASVLQKEWEAIAGDRAIV
ncbi:hypothetical protein E8E14_009821 [Neopestalotiopsis sp. 37M]|nr:hypothetical protein E8E14_009821 [Neopestalotiopsis sp. 37M]